MEYFLPYQWKKDVPVITDCGPQCELVNKKSPQEGEEYLWSSSHQTAATPYSESPGELRMWKHRLLAPIAEMHIKGMVSVSPDSCIFSYIEKH